MVAFNLVPILCLYPVKRAAASSIRCTRAMACTDSASEVAISSTSTEPTAADACEHSSSLSGASAPSRSGGVVLSGRAAAMLLPMEVWWTCVAGLIYMGKWAWWEIYFAQWCADEFGASVPTASLYIACIAAAFGCGVPLAGSLGDRLGARRLDLMAGSIVGLVGLYLFMGPWQLAAYDLPLRQALFFVYLAGDGLVCCLIEPQLLPHMLNLAESKRDAGEYLTNLVTALGQSAMNLGQIAGPFVAVPIVSASGFRGALTAWAFPLALVVAWAGVLLCSRACRVAKATAPKRLVDEAEAPS